MDIEKELRLKKGIGELHKAHLNVLFTAGVLYNRVRSVLKPHGLTVEQFNVLRILRGAGEKMCVKEIAGRMLDRSSNVSRIIDKLVAHNYVLREQSTADKRETSVVLTEAGLRHITQVTGLVQPSLDSIMNLSEKEAKKLNELLDKSR